MYGPTETTIWSACGKVESGNGPMLIGRPIGNTQIYVLDAHREPVPVGVPGELYIGGAGLARGYLRRAELTAEKFLESPFEEGARIYRTGDLARYLPGGELEVLGRLDFQVKIRGFRIELPEIESVLADHPAITRAVVLAREDEPGEKRLVAYVKFANDRHANVSELRHFLESRLPEYMIPAAFVPLDSFPVTPNGKLDRKALPPPQTQRPDLDTPYAEPGSKLEKRLASMWCEILKLESVGIDDRFFELGGSSLQAAQFTNAIQQRLGEAVYIVTIFEASSIREFALLLQRDYSQSLPKLVPELTAPAKRPENAAAARGAEGKITAETISRMKQFIPMRAGGIGSSEARNPPALFILAPPRSGTTLLRVMLSGHPKLFGAAELQLLGFNTLQERKAAFTGKYSLWLEGTIRAIMDIRHCGADEAKEIMQEYEDRGYSTQAFYGVLQEWIGDKTLVDKSPAYACDPVALGKSEEEFQDALYVQLVRHPYAMIRSFESYRMDQVVFLRDHPFTARELGEMIWTISHQNTMKFLQTVPRDRQCRLRFEDLVSSPEPVLKDLCSRLGLEFHPDLLNPYKNTENKMTDGIYRESTPMGDRKFLEHKRIDPKIADRWRAVADDNFLGDVTWEVAEALGYERPTEEPKEETAARPGSASEARRTFAERQRLRRRSHRRSNQRD